MGADRNFVLLVVLVNHVYIPADWSKRNSVLLVKAPSIIKLSEFFRIELFNDSLSFNVWVLMDFALSRIVAFTPI